MKSGWAEAGAGHRQLPAELARLYALLRCPACSAGLRPGDGLCTGCGRPFELGPGRLDLLADDARAHADRFAQRYRELRRKEGWAGSNGQEDPDRADPRLWTRRVEAVRGAAALLEGELSGSDRPVVGDIGAGGGWATRFFASAHVVAFDLLEVPSEPVAAVAVRADMRRLPVRDGVLDGLLYTAAIHYAAIGEAIQEAARVLRPDGLLVAIESPMYPGPRAAARAAARSTEYYAAMGYPELAADYHPIDVSQLTAELARSGFRIERLDTPRRRYGLRRLVGRRHRLVMLVARRT